MDCVYDFDPSKMSREELKSYIGEEIAEKSIILEYMKKGRVDAAGGLLRDWFTGKTMMGRYLCERTDGEYYWGDDIVYHFEKYNLKLKDDFIQHVLSKSKDK